MSLGMLTLDAEERIVAANDEARRLYQTDDLVGMTRPQLWRRLGYAHPTAAAADLPRSRYRLAHLPDGSTRGFCIHISRGADGTGFDMVFEPADWSLGFAEQMETAVCVTDECWNVVYANRATEALVGRPSQAICGHSALSAARLLINRPADVEALFAAIAGGDRMLDSYTLKLHGRLRRVRVHTSPWRYRGLPCGVIWVVTDLTDDVEGQRQAATAIWYRVAATFQHELRNPLQTMQAAIDVLRPQLPSEALRPLQLLQQQVYLVGDYLIDQLQPPPPTFLSLGRLSDVVQAEIERAAARLVTHRLQIEHRRLDAEPPIRLHSGSMGRVLANVLRNAGEARPDARVVIAYAATAESLTCTVADDGPGFGDHVLRSHLLGRPHNPTAGLGLAIAASTVEAHGGTVTFSNRASGGAVVVLRLPTVPVVPPPLRDVVVGGARE